LANPIWTVKPSLQKPVTGFLSKLIEIHEVLDSKVFGNFGKPTGVFDLASVCQKLYFG
jgi:hypothetical protein